MSNDLKIYQEHQKYCEELKFVKKQIGYNVIYKDQLRFFNDKDYFAYYIGAMWLDTIPKDGENSQRLAVIVEPKIENIDFMAMFLACLKHRESEEGFDDIYKIYFDDVFIEYKDLSTLPELEPLLIAHFIYCLEPLIRKGLKHNFTHYEENISTLKGKLMFNQHLKKNISQNRNHKAFCRFAQYDINCIENRILKKALTICQNTKFNYSELKTKLAHCLTAFQGVSDDISHIDIKHVKINPLYREYKPAIEIAKQIIRLHRQTEGQQKLAPPFWIDMPLLFERYVYSLMLDNKNEWGKILYQKKTQSGVPDFLLSDKSLIIDTKYKPKYLNKQGILADVRQISAYSRHKTIRKLLNSDDNSLVKCLIVYPLKKSNKHYFVYDEDKWRESSLYQEFFFVGVPLPISN